MPSSVELSLYANSDEIFTIQKINEDIIPALLSHLSIAQHSIPLWTPDNNNNNNNYSSNGNSSNNSSLHHQHNYLNGQLDKLQRDLNYIKDAFEMLKKFEDQVSDPIKSVLHNVDDILKVVTKVPEGSFRAGLVQTKLRKLNDTVTKLKLQVPSAHKVSSADSHRYTRSNPSTSNGYNARNVFDGLPILHVNEQFRCSSAFKDIQEIYESLNRTSKICLLCFAVFPENEVEKKRLLRHWWIGEHLVVPPSTGDKTAEDVAEDIFKELTVKGFIEPVNKKRRLDADSFKMHPFIHSAVIMLAQEARFFDFDSEGTPTANFLSCYRACLVKSEAGSSQQVSINSPDLDQGKLQTLFNVNEPYLGFELEWFSKMKNVNVLYLGRWQSSAKHHIEVEDTEFLKGLKNMKYLTFFSLQGISRITELPDSIGMLTNLRILDLRACHSLEVLPDEIRSLKNLTHLDMSECYLLDHMPKGLASLIELQVLKGFVIGDPKSRSSCTLDDLVNLKKLRKLSISTGWEAFPTEKELIAFQQFKALRKLTIAWGGGSVQAKSDNSSKQESGAAESGTVAATKTLSRLLAFKRDKVTVTVIAALPMALEKLDLQCFPRTTPPSWLMPGKLKSLKKLYIRGGKLHCLGPVQEENDRWTVEILRLKFLCELKMDWRKLQALFPDLIYLEKVKCPKLTFFPCDESGVWLNEKNGTNAVARN